MAGLPARNDVPLEETWDLSHLFADEAEYTESLEAVKQQARDLKDTYENRIAGSSNTGHLIQLAKDYAGFYERMIKLATYASLPMQADITDPENLKRAGSFNILMNSIMTDLSFIVAELQEVSDETLQAAAEENAETASYFRDLLRDRPYQLGQEAEKLLIKLDDALGLPYEIYGQAKLSDLRFKEFEANGETYPNSFVLFENNYNEHPDKEVRRKGFRSFSEDLSAMRATVAAAYASQVRKEKAIADLRGYDTVFDYLLHDQKVSRELYDRQIDGIMSLLSGPMRRYAELLKKVHKLDAIHYADLKMPLDPNMNPEVSIDEAWEYASESLKLLGDDYADIVDRAKRERWVDFAQNKGKSTGGFCSSPYKANSFILLNWSGNLSEVFTLVHELGHAGHFQLAAQHQSLFDYSVSRYVVEAPSTGNELIFGRYLRAKFSDDPRKRRWVIASQIGNTYYHNFVTHLLEADFQRKVYRAVEEGKPLQADDFDALYKETLENFWGDSVVLDEGAEMTWMRQPHYYMGLYSYTYSAGLTIATAWNKRVDDEGPQVAEDWLNALKAGGSVEVDEFARLAGVDITTDSALQSAISYVSEMVDELWTLSEELGEIREPA